MIEETISAFTKYLMIGCLSFAIIIFTWCAIKSKSIRSFQFQISAFLAIWIAGELSSILLNDVIEDAKLENLANLIHLVAMALFAMMISLRFFESKRKEKKIMGNHSNFFLDEERHDS